VCHLFREGGPTIFAQVKHGVGMDAIVSLILSAWKASGAPQSQKLRQEFLERQEAAKAES
jgi:urease accessory protein